MNKRKAKALIDSDSDDVSDSDTDTELLGLSKKKKASASSDSDSVKSSPPPPKKVIKAASSSESETSDSDSDWDAPKGKKKEKPAPKAKPKAISESHNEDSGSEKENGKGSDTEPEEGEASDSGTGSDSASSSDDEDDDDSDEFDDGLDINLIGDEEDRKRMEQMTEKEREQELFNRAEKRDILKARFEIEKKLRLAKKSQLPKKKDKTQKDKTKSKKVVAPLTDRKRTMEENKVGRNDKFAALKAKREFKFQKAEEREKKEKVKQEKKKDHKKDHKEKREKESGTVDDEAKAKRKLKSDDVFSSEESDAESEKSAKSGRSRRSSTSSSRSGSRSRSRSRSSSRSGSGSDSDRSDRSRREPKKPELVTCKEDLEKIRVSRYKMEKFVHLPLFAKAIIGCFVRIGIGNNQGKPVYRVAEIKQVVQTAKIYNLGTTRTNKGLKLLHANQERVFRLEFVSNSAISESEYQRWVETCAQHNVELPKQNHIKKKEKDVKDLLYYQFSNSDIDNIIQEKARFSSNPTNYAIAKTDLLKQKEQATQDANEDRLVEIDVKLNELEERAAKLDKKRTTTIASILYINERNRKVNIDKAEKAILAEVAANKGMKIADPFTRRSTRPMMVSMLKSDEFQEEISEENEKRRDAAKKLEDIAMKLKRKEDEIINKRLDQIKKREDERKADMINDPFSAHNFDIKIDLDVALPSGTSTASATQRVLQSNASVNGTTTNSAPKRSLKFEEYKKKRGLI